MKHPVAVILEGYRAEVLDEASAQASAIVKGLILKLAKHNWNLDDVAPRPTSHDFGHAFTSKQYIRTLYQQVTEREPQVTFRRDEPVIVKPSDERRARFIKSAVDAASARFDVFVAKMVERISQPDDVASTEVTGTITRADGYGTIAVTFSDKTVSRWKAQPIHNVSKLGTPFMQWRVTKAR